MENTNQKKETNPFMMSIEELDAEVERIPLVRSTLDEIVEIADNIQTHTGWRRSMAPWVISLLTSHNNSLVERLEGLKKDGSDETRDRIEKAGDGHLYERIIGYNIALTESQELIKNRLT